MRCALHEDPHPPPTTTTNSFVQKKGVNFWSASWRHRRHPIIWFWWYWWDITNTINISIVSNYISMTVFSWNGVAGTGAWGGRILVEDEPAGTLALTRCSIWEIWVLILLFCSTNASIWAFRIGISSAWVRMVSSISCLKRSCFAEFLIRCFWPF